MFRSLCVGLFFVFLMLHSQADAANPFASLSAPQAAPVAPPAVAPAPVLIEEEILEQLASLPAPGRAADDAITAQFYLYDKHLSRKLNTVLETANANPKQAITSARNIKDELQRIKYTYQLTSGVQEALTHAIDYTDRLIAKIEGKRASRAVKCVPVPFDGLDTFVWPAQIARGKPLCLSVGLTDPQMTVFNLTSNIAKLTNPDGKRKITALKITDPITEHNFDRLIALLKAMTANVGVIKSVLFDRVVVSPALMTKLPDLVPALKMSTDKRVNPHVRLTRLEVLQMNLVESLRDDLSASYANFVKLVGSSISPRSMTIQFTPGYVMHPAANDIIRGGVRESRMRNRMLPWHDSASFFRPAVLRQDDFVARHGPKKVFNFETFTRGKGAPVAAPVAPPRRASLRDSGKSASAPAPMAVPSVPDVDAVYTEEDYERELKEAMAASLRDSGARTPAPAPAPMAVPEPVVAPVSPLSPLSPAAPMPAPVAVPEHISNASRALGLPADVLKDGTGKWLSKSKVADLLG